MPQKVSGPDALPGAIRAGEFGKRDCAEFPPKDAAFQEFPAGRAESSVVDPAEVRLRRDVEKVHPLGPRALFELFEDLGCGYQRLDIEQLHRHGPNAVYEQLVAVGCERLIRVRIERTVARYARLDPAALRAVGGDRFPAGEP